MTTESDTLMNRWEQGSPMRSFIYYLQRATCGALAYLVIHQFILGLRMIQLSEKFRGPWETLLHVLSTPGRFLVREFLHPTRPMNLPPPLAVFFFNTVFYFLSVWLFCYVFNLISGRSFVGKRQDPFVLLPRENSGK